MLALVVSLAGGFVAAWFLEPDAGPQQQSLLEELNESRGDLALSWDESREAILAEAAARVGRRSPVASSLPHVMAVLICYLSAVGLVSLLDR